MRISHGATTSLVARQRTVGERCVGRWRAWALALSPLSECCPVLTLRLPSSPSPGTPASHAPASSLRTLAVLTPLRRTSGPWDRARQPTMAMTPAMALAIRTRMGQILAKMVRPPRPRRPCQLRQTHGLVRWLHGPQDQGGSRRPWAGCSMGIRRVRTARSCQSRKGGDGREHTLVHFSSCLTIQ